jgi:hypothetical protein
MDFSENILNYELCCERYAVSHRAYASCCGLDVCSFWQTLERGFRLFQMVPANLTCEPHHMSCVAQSMKTRRCSTL